MLKLCLDENVNIDWLRIKKVRFSKVASSSTSFISPRSVEGFTFRSRNNLEMPKIILNSSCPGVPRHFLD